MSKLQIFTNKKYSSGFTLIELLVVIAIIGILSSVVLASLGNARKNAREASIATTLSSARTQAELYHGQNGSSYTGLCQDEQIQQMVDSMSGTGDDAACYVSTDQYSGGSYKGEALAGVDFGVVAYYDDVFSAVSSLGIGTFDGSTKRDNISWSTAKSHCLSDGKRMPSPSELMAIYEMVTYPSSGFSSSGIWSGISEKSNNSDAYIVNLGSGEIYGPSKTSSNSITCVE